MHWSNAGRAANNMGVIRAIGLGRGRPPAWQLSPIWHGAGVDLQAPPTLSTFSALDKDDSSSSSSHSPAINHIAAIGVLPRLMLEAASHASLRGRKNANSYLKTRSSNADGF